MSDTVDHGNTFVLKRRKYVVHKMLDEREYCESSCGVWIPLDCPYGWVVGRGFHMSVVYNVRP